MNVFFLELCLLLLIKHGICDGLGTLHQQVKRQSGLTSSAQRGFAGFVPVVPLLNYGYQINQNTQIGGSLGLIPDDPSKRPFQLGGDFGIAQPKDFGMGLNAGPVFVNPYGGYQDLNAQPVQPVGGLDTFVLNKLATPDDIFGAPGQPRPQSGFLRQNSQPTKSGQAVQGLPFVLPTAAQANAAQSFPTNTLQGLLAANNAQNRNLGG